jgi:hypothetical protein
MEFQLLYFLNLSIGMPYYQEEHKIYSLYVEKGAQDDLTNL